MSPVLRIVILALIGVALFFVGLAAGLMSDSEFDAPLIEYVDRPGEAPDPIEVPVTVRTPIPYAIADEDLGAYRVNGFVEFRGRGPATQMRSVRQLMACFPLEGL